ncbi:MAG: SPOR domain-containing protein [Sulfitobacter sp. SK025]|nr:MAG: SPOR domain-containing protein [Sulfitobacter sp. SK025]
MNRLTLPLPHTSRTIGVLVALTVLVGCEGIGPLGLGQGNSASGQTESTKLVERDVEAPDVFSVTDKGLWDGRPSLGGVWVAHPDVTEPERVIIRNEANGKFVIGALFRRERDLPGPKLQISSDAAAALNILAGAPAPLNVTALRREEVDAPVQDSAPDATIKTPSAVTETALAPVVASPPATPDAEPASAAEVAVSAPPAPKAAALPAATPNPTSTLAKPYVQIGIFSIEANANRAANQMRSAGMVPSVKRSEINGKAFWRVVVGPAATNSELNSLLKSIKTEGYSDAYAVSS